MKKLLVMICAIAIMATFAIGVSAAETVIYQNDFSDDLSITDFDQYRMQWTVYNGGLYMTGQAIAGSPSIWRNQLFGHIAYKSAEPLTDYVVDVDLMNIQTAAGVVVRMQPELLDNTQSGIYGYQAYVGDDASVAAFGVSNAEGVWSMLLDGLVTPNVFQGANLHFNIIVKGDKIGTKITNKDTGKMIYDTIYTIGSQMDKDPLWTEGTFGFRMRMQTLDGKYVNSDTAYFDNLVVTTANETEPALTVVDTTPERIDVSAANLTEVYRNEFNSADDIKDFLAVYGEWSVKDGKLYLTDVESASSSLLLYNGKDELKNLKDYVLDVDIYNVQTQNGVFVRSQLDKVINNPTGNGEDFYGYIGYTGTAGNQAAMGFGAHTGKWGGLVDDNCVSNKDIFAPGGNLHLQLAVQGTNLQIVLRELESGKLLWTDVRYQELWESGTFGFRTMTLVSGQGLDNVNNTAFDNLVISTLKDSGTASNTEIKMTVGKMTGYVNGKATTLDAAPVIRNSRTMLPVRFVAENLGATVGWDGKTSTVTVKSANTTIEIVIGATTAKVNGKSVTLDSPAYIDASNNRTYLPVRFVSENLGATVGWDGTTSTVTLTK